MKKWTLILASALSVNLVSAQYNDQFNNVIGTISPAMNGFVNGLFGTSVTGTGWLSIAAYFVLIAVLLNTLMKRNSFMNESKGLRIAISVIGTYFLVNNPIMLERIIPGTGNVVSIVIMAGSLLLLTWMLPMLTMSAGMVSKQAEHREKGLSRKEKKRIKMDEKLNQMQQFLATQEQQLEFNEKRLEQAEDDQLGKIAEDLKLILQTAEAEATFKKYMDKAQKLAKSLKDPLQIQQIENRYQQYQAKLKEYELKLNAALQRLEQDEATEEQEEKQEEGLIEQEEGAVDKELSEEKKAISNEKKNLHDEVKESKDSHLSVVKRQEEGMKASTTVMELRVEKNKSTLMKEKKSLVSRKGGLRSGVKSRNEKIKKLLSETKAPNVDPEKKKSAVNEMIQLNELKVATNRELEQINDQLQNINNQLKQLEEQDKQIEQKEESQVLRTAA